MQSAVALTPGLLIGAGYRWFDVPEPAPPNLVVVMTLGHGDTISALH